MLDGRTVSNGGSNSVKTTRRSLDIIETLREMGGARLTELAARLDIPNSTAHSHLSALVDRDYVLKDGDIYRVSLRFLDLGEHARNRHTIYSLAKSEIDSLARQTGEMATLLVKEGGRGVYLYASEGENAVPLDIHPGKHVDLHVTACGKCILAHLAEAKGAEIIDQHGLPARTDNSITDRDALYNDLETVRKRGFAVSDEERVVGVRCVGSPVKAESGKVIGAIGVSGPTSALTDARLTESIPEHLSAAVNVIELRVAYS